MLKGVIFDMDGVLVNNTDMHIKAFEIFCKRYGVDGWKNGISNLYGMGNDDIMRALMPADILERKNMKELSDEKEQIYRDIYAPTIKPQNGLIELLQQLRECGISCAVGSSACRDNVDFVLEKCNMAEYFGVIVCGDDVKACKPSPEIYLTVASRMGLRPEECLVFEDSRAGIASGKNAGMKVVALATSLSREILEQETAADCIIDDFTWIDTEQLKQLSTGQR